jgi:hypothetical protein
MTPELWVTRCFVSLCIPGQRAFQGLYKDFCKPCLLSLAARMHRGVASL